VRLNQTDIEVETFAGGERFAERAVRRRGIGDS